MPDFKITTNPDGTVTAEKTTVLAEDAARDIPQWATWDETQALDWIESNVDDLASAKTVLKAYARLLVALRDAQWPNLNDS